MERQELEEIYAREQGRFMEELCRFLAFESISTDPAFNPQCIECAKWLAQQFEGLGFKVSLLETGTKPAVYAESAGGAGPTVLFYGHYDVQPVDPVSDWMSPPFKPEERNGRLYARGAQDNKGQLWYVVKALETLIGQNELACCVKVLIEGEEESQSTGIFKNLPKWKDFLGADILMVCDTGAMRSGVPCITMGLRGMIYLEARLLGAPHDFHSGALGGVVKNPATEMARLIATLHRNDGGIAVEGYCDGLVEPEAEERRLANASLPSETELERMLSVKPVGGESGYTPAERRGFRPTIEVNGLYSGYQGAGSKTIIPASAGVKITSRLGFGQDPARCLERLCDHLCKNAPQGLTLEIFNQGVGGPALKLSADSKLIRFAKEILDQIGTAPTEFTWEGGSIPVVSSLARASGAEPLLVGFGLEEDRIHAPNESFSLEQWRLGFLYAGMLLSRLDKLGAKT